VSGESFGFPGPGGHWRSGTFTALDDYGEGGAASASSNELIVGETYDLVDQTYRGRATVWDSAGVPHRVTGIDTDYSRINDINAAGHYVGTTIQLTATGGVFGGFVGRGGSATRLDYPGFPETRAFEINDEGWIVGFWKGPGGARRGYIARGDEIRDLGLYPGYAETWTIANNNEGTVVGAAANFGADFERALIWPNGSLVPLDLNQFIVDLPAGVTLIDAYQINNAGQILGTGFSPASGYAYYVLTPVPEPTAAAAACLLAVLAFRRRR
jgi:hypothetical protein